MERQERQKPRVLFPFVEAGMGHIMPMTAIADAFEAKYGDAAEVVRVKFFQAQGDAELLAVEADLIRQVKNHNRSKWYGIAQFLVMRVLGTRLSMSLLMRRHYRGGFYPSLEYLRTLQPDLVVNTHFSTLYYACTAQRKGLIDAAVVNYCPDPVIGRQWDTRADLHTLSSELGRKKAARRFGRSRVRAVPFMLRGEVQSMNEGRQYYRRQLGLPEEQFTILLCDGAYGAGKLRETVYELLQYDRRMTVVALCGRNEALLQEFRGLTPPRQVTFVPCGFTDRALEYAAACDLFMGKAGASNLAEPAYFGAPAIVTFTATKIEKWIAAHHVRHVGSAVRIRNVEQAVRTAMAWMEDPAAMRPYAAACLRQRRTDGPELFADLLWEQLRARRRGKAKRSVLFQWRCRYWQRRLLRWSLDKF